MARYLLLTIAFLLAGIAATGQTSLEGTVTDAESGEPIIFGTVALYKNDVLITGTETDFDGYYSLTELDAGTYDVVFSYTGYQDFKITDVLVNSGKVNALDAKVSSGINIDLDIVVKYERPLVSKDETTQGKVFSSEEIAQLPTRNVNALASLGAGATASDDGEAINIRGSRSNGTDVYIDGVRVFGNSSIPPQYIEELQVITGGIEARYGDVTGGIISITTKGPSDKFSGGVELETSEGLDAFGQRLASLNLSGPIWKKGGQTILGYRLGGQYLFNKDDDPPATAVFKATDSYIEQLEAEPVIQLGATLLPSARYATNENVELLDYNPNEERTTIDLNGKLDANLGNNIDVTLSGTYTDIDDQFTPNQRDDNDWTVFNSARNPHDISTRLRGNFRFRHRLGTTSNLGDTAGDEEAVRKGSLIQNAVYTLQFGYERAESGREDAVHGDNLFNYGYYGSWDLDWDPTIANVQGREINNLPWTDQNGNTDTLAFVFEDFAQQTDYTRSIGPGGYVPDPNINPILANYNVNADDIDNFDNFLYRNGRTESQLGANWINHFANVGSVYNLFRKRETDTYTFNANTSFQLVPGGSGSTRHSIQFGILYEQRVQRGYDINPRQLWTVAELLANQHLEGAGIDSTNIVGSFTSNYRLYIIDPITGQPVDLVDENGVVQNFEREYDIFALDPIISSESKFLREVRRIDGMTETPVYQYFNVHELNPDQLSLDMFSARELNDQQGLLGLNYWGYDYLGNPIDNVSFNDFFTATDEQGIRTFPVAAFRPNYQAAFIQDKFTFKDVIFRVGLRVDRFDANTKVLKDPYSLYDIREAGDVNFATHPGNIGDDFKVYVTSEGSEQIQAYRDGDTWYFPSGAPANSGSEIFGGTAVTPLYATENAAARDVTSPDFDPDISFEDYEPQVNWMPRLAFSFPISDEANFFAHYDVLVQRPPSNAFVTPLTYFYWESNGSDRRNNANLRPERTVDYEVGFQQKLSNSSAIKMSAYYKELRDMIQSRWYLNADPVSEYETFDNLDFATVKGFNLSYDLRRTGNLSLNLAYTLQFADGTGSNETSSQGLSSRGIQRALFPVSFDERHRLTGIIDYRYGAGKEYNGPRIGGLDILANTGLNLTTIAVSGRPYTAAQQSQAFGAAGNRGAINGSRLPWNFTLNARLDKQFNLTKPGAKRQLGLNVYVRVSNLLDRRNIVGVYRATGSPTDDGYLASAQGQTILNSDQFELVDGSFDEALFTAFTNSYSWRLLNPDNFSLPRRIFAGAVVNF
ncbi:MAG: TonB-dependent receptor [Bacteroidota bacterium]